MKIADPVEVTEEGNLLVRSVKTPEKCREEGYQYEWIINLYSFAFDKEDTKEHLGLSDSGFLEWLVKITHKTVEYRKKSDKDKLKL